ncbi:gamma-glutamyl-gamma-aminobutyrate hydrolase family protein [Ottowia sp.]|uniref:gamma-glutamyl-gamma-aminobutyrate hydrolase family protein n=1 Tax=Ottowia sp. TaxID=1898956 RepID=UPI002BE5C2DC|nr:gamma-glutamyl-gamma-aminobutyrate hydrolase family protein [Ottowia sp.]HRN75868.1 gamma-glutamyl-gamma-aminobutyrate hydrolase family protein [Ottowia sp.]HRQ03212.1 gamma-glutamyl-gamma-aminobutyrate hydrolase family protein [Ottowia sp.]
MTLRIGISARLLHNPPPGLGLPTKRLQFLESGMANWIMSHGVLALMIPFIDQRGIKLRKRPPLHDLVDNLDGLVLQGGIDISPTTYGATPWQEKAEYDPIRDEYELDLLRGFIQADKPVLGICRGCQLLNVYFGGTLIQDIPTQWPGAILHNDVERYDSLVHEVHFMPGSRLSDIYGYEPRRVTSIHHQCVDQLGRGLVLEARSPIDLVPEGIRHTDHAFVMGVQWHPEFHPNASNENEPVLDSGPLLMAFLKAALRRAGRVRQLADRVARVRERASELVGR